MPSLSILLQILVAILGVLPGAALRQAFRQPALFGVVITNEQSIHSSTKTINGQKESPMKVTTDSASGFFERVQSRFQMVLAAPMRAILRTVLFVLIAPGALVMAQDRPVAEAAKPIEDPLIAHNRSLYDGTKKILIRTAENMPEENYSFEPTEAVRTFGQIVGHIADAQYLFCSVVLGEKNPRLRIEQTKTSKADLVAALKDTFALCDRAYDSMTAASAVQMVKFMGGDKPKLGVLTTNNLHVIEHYGNLVTYMRLKGLVPPTSDPEFMKSLAN